MTTTMVFDSVNSSFSISTDDNSHDESIAFMDHSRRLQFIEDVAQTAIRIFLGALALCCILAYLCRTIDENEQALSPSGYSAPPPDTANANRTNVRDSLSSQNTNTNFRNASPRVVPRRDKTTNNDDSDQNGRDDEAIDNSTLHLPSKEGRHEQEEPTKRRRKRSSKKKVTPPKIVP